MVDGLRRRGLVAWIDYLGIAAFHNARRQISNALVRSGGVLLLLSERSAFRPWVAAELREAAHHGLPIVLALIEDVHPPPWCKGWVVVRLYAQWELEMDRATDALTLMGARRRALPPHRGVVRARARSSRPDRRLRRLPR